MVSFVYLCEFCAAQGVAFHMVGSVGRFAIDANRCRRGVWTSGYMRQKWVQYELFQRYRVAGLTCRCVRVRVCGVGPASGQH